MEMEFKLADSWTGLTKDNHWSSVYSDKKKSNIHKICSKINFVVRGDDNSRPVLFKLKGNTYWIRLSELDKIVSLSNNGVNFENIESIKYTPGSISPSTPPTAGEFVANIDGYLVEIEY